MENILIVKYTPREERSKTKQLLDNFIEKMQNKNIEVLDLEKDMPEFFTKESLNAYYMRNYVGEKLTEVQLKSLEKYDRFVKQFIKAKKIVFAYPMYNFSMPGIIKTYLDMVLQKGVTWTIDENGYKGLCNDKEILLITSSGGVYNEEMGNLPWEHNISFMKVMGTFIGAKFNFVSAQGLNMTPEKEKQIMSNAQNQLNSISSNWRA